MSIKLRHLAISCPNPGETSKRYARLFGLKVVSAEDPRQMVFLTDGYFNLAFIGPGVVAETTDLVRSSKGFAIHHIGFTVPSLSEFRALAEGEGCKLLKEYGTSKVLKFQDPDGLIFDVGAEDHWGFA